jgi:hypothetical protein
MEHRKAMVSDTTNALNANRLARIAVDPVLRRSSATKPPGTVKAAAANATVAMRTDPIVPFSHHDMPFVVRSPFFGWVRVCLLMKRVEPSIWSNACSQSQPAQTIQHGKVLPMLISTVIFRSSVLTILGNCNGVFPS